MTMIRFSAILLHCFTLAMHSISYHGTVEKCMEICVFRITRNKRDWDILTGYCSVLFFNFLFVCCYIWPETIDSVADLHYATVLLQEPITRLGSITRRACMRDEGSG